MSSLKLLDLFSGTGGFALGAHQAGFEVAAAVDNDPILSSSYARNFPNTKLLTKDISSLKGEEILRLVGGKVDGVFGGPPCQGFSEIGRREQSDPRRKLLGHFFRLVQELSPAFFIMENVRGLMHENARIVLESALEMVSNNYHIIGPHIFDAADFGAATRRPRVFVLGFRKEINVSLSLEEIKSQQRPAVSVRDAIQDLKNSVKMTDVDGFDSWKLRPARKISEYARTLRSIDGIFTGHRVTQHTPEVIARFRTVQPGSTDKIGRHQRLSWDGQCPTLRAGTGADKGSYQAVRPLHPEEPRVITVREAARLQGFPDSHLFHPTVWHSFRMIGNSVSPIMARAIFTSVKAAYLA